MLEHMAIIDECDILGQKLEAGNKIHKVRRGFSVSLGVTFLVLTKHLGACSGVQGSLEFLHCRTKNPDE